MKVGEWYENTRSHRLYCGLEVPPATGKARRFVCHTKDGELCSFTSEGKYYVDGTKSVQDIVRHLPGCTGFDWQEPKIPEGWRRLADNEILEDGDEYLRPDGTTDTVCSYVGRTVKTTREIWCHPPTYPYAIIRKIEEPKPEPKFKVGDVVYATKPKDVAQHPTWDSHMDKTAGVPLKVVRVDNSDCIHFCEVDKNTGWFYHEDWLSKEPPAAQYRPFANDEEYAPHFDRKVLRAHNRYPHEKGCYRIAAYDEIGVWSHGQGPTSYEKMFHDGRKFADTNEPFGVKIS